MLSIVQKFYREICLLLLVLCGLACGYLAAVILGSTLRQPVLFATPERTGPQMHLPRIVTNDLNLILQRNIFDMAARGNTSFDFNRTAALGEEGQASQRTDLTLFGTLVAGSKSTALIRVGAESALYHLDEQIPGGGRVEEIRRNQVTIRYQDRSQAILSMYEETPRRAENPSSPEGSDVRSVGENRWKVAQSVAEEAREDIGEQLRLAQLEPRLVQGQTVGFLVRKLNPRSLLVQMGLRRGDVVLQVNDMKLDSPEKALQVLQQLREARQLSVDVERAGKPMTFIYEIE